MNSGYGVTERGIINRGLTMKKFLIATAALGSVALAAPAFAADMPVKAAPPVVAPALYDWTGFYLGVEGGAVLGQRTEWHFLNALAPASKIGTATNHICATGATVPVLGASATGAPTVTRLSAGPGTCEDVGHPLHGGFVGGEIGFNWQAPGSRWVLGIEADGNWAELEEALTCAVPFQGFTCGSKIRDFETVRGRIGYAFGPRGDFLVFVTGGWATANVEAFEGELFPPFVTVKDRRRHNGFVVGGGAEYGITPWLSLKGEVLFVGLAGEDHCFGNCAAVQTGTVVINTITRTFVTAVPAHVQENFIAARIALNWRFNWGKGAPAAVVASY